ncbi:hypothetical protein J6590_020502, partial [Homalodisca vitripennis]
RDVHLQSGEWFYQQLRQRFRSTVAALDNTDKNDGEVQEFMEKLVETIIGGGLDDVTLCPLSDRPEYTNFCALYKDPLVHILRRLYANLRMALSDSASQDGEASDLHSELKDLLKQIIHDAMSQPQFKEGNGTASWMCQEGEAPASLDQKSYEDILATAILNKIFAKYQQNRFRRKRKSRSNEKSFDKNSNLLSSEKSPEAMQDELPRSESDSDSVANSLDDGSWSESSHIEPLSVTIEECIEEVTTRYSSDDEAEPKSDMDRFLSNLKYIRRQRAPFPELGKDIVDGDISSSDGDGRDDAGGEVDKDDLSAGVELLNPVDSWEENWLFQRRRLKTGMGTCQPVPVPMLVPNPTEDCRAMIGDVDADEMSDLSDCSDSVLEDLLDGPDDRKYFESQQEESDEEKPIEVIDKQREIFLQYITEDLNKLIEPRSEDRGLSPDTGQSETVSSDIAQEAQVTTVAEELTVKDQSTGSPEETDSSHSYSVAETRNLNVPIVQIDSGEGSLDMQQDSEYTVAYATVAQVRPSSQEPSPAPSSAPSPIPKPRTVRPPLEPHEEPTDEKSDEERNSLAELSLPPKPGTIAEREHLKWEKAPPLANNPYSKENIARRQRQRMYLSRHSSSENSIEFPELTPTKEPSLMEIDSKHRRDDFNKYVRDYYVNVAEDKAVEGQKQPTQVRPSSAEPRLSPSQTAKSCPSQQQVSVRVEVEVALSKPSSSPGVPTPTQTTAHHHQVTTVVAPDDDYISLPSVKELAKQFSSPDEKIPSPAPTIPSRKQADLRLHSPVRQVHSLTARNMSREFRETLRSVSVPVVKVASDSSGHVSEDSGTVSPTPCPPPRKLKLQDDIQFWEQLRQQR